MKYVIKEVNFSYREDQSTPSSEKTSEVKSYITAHAIYEYGNTQSTVSCDVYLIATKSYSSTGDITVVPGTGEFPSSDKVLELLKAEIESKIASDQAEELYRTLLKEKLAQALVLEGLPQRGRSVDPGKFTYDM